MRRRLLEWLGNLILLGVSVGLTLAALELVVFRNILVPDDVLPNVTLNSVVRYQPDTRAIFRYPDGRQAVATINANGWNSQHPKYVLPRTPGRLRVAIIGDSYVHSRFVDPGQSFAAVLEHNLKQRGFDAEVFRFGMDGAPLSQYLHMLRAEVRAFKPDVVLVQLIHNDFDESYRMLHTRTGSSFMKLSQAADGAIVEILPSAFKPGFADRLRAFATFRYLYYQTGLYLRLNGLVSRYFWGGNEDWDPRFVSSGVDIRKVNDHPSNELFAGYVVAKMAEIAAQEGFTLAFAMDGVREAIYEGLAPMDYEVGRLNRIAARVTTAHGLPFFDLHDVFAADYKAHGQRFEYPYDWHWNARANRLVGEKLAELVAGLPPFAERALKRRPESRSSEVRRPGPGRASTAPTHKPSRVGPDGRPTAGSGVDVPGWHEPPRLRPRPLQIADPGLGPRGDGPLPAGGRR